MGWRRMQVKESKQLRQIDNIVPRRERLTTCMVYISLSSFGYSRYEYLPLTASLFLLYSEKVKNNLHSDVRSDERHFNIFFIQIVRTYF